MAVQTMPERLATLMDGLPANTPVYGGYTRLSKPLETPEEWEEIRKVLGEQIQRYQAQGRCEIGACDALDYLQLTDPTYTDDAETGPSYAYGWRMWKAAE